MGHKHFLVLLTSMWMENIYYANEFSLQFYSSKRISVAAGLSSETCSSSIKVWKYYILMSVPRGVTVEGEWGCGVEIPLAMHLFSSLVAVCLAHSCIQQWNLCLPNIWWHHFQFMELTYWVLQWDTLCANFQNVVQIFRTYWKFRNYTAGHHKDYKYNCCFTLPSVVFYMLWETKS